MDPRFYPANQDVVFTQTYTRTTLKLQSKPPYNEAERWPHPDSGTQYNMRSDRDLHQRRYAREGPSVERSSVPFPHHYDPGPAPRISDKFHYHGPASHVQEYKGPSRNATNPGPTEAEIYKNQVRARFKDDDAREAFNAEILPKYDVNGPLAVAVDPRILNVFGEPCVYLFYQSARRIPSLCSRLHAADLRSCITSRDQNGCHWVVASKEDAKVIKFLGRMRWTTIRWKKANALSESDIGETSVSLVFMEWSGYLIPELRGKAFQAKIPHALMSSQDHSWILVAKDQIQSYILSAQKK